MTKSAPFMAKATIEEDKDGYHLDIELANGFSVSIGLWCDCQEHPDCQLFNHTCNGNEPDYFGIEEFKEWAEIAVGKQPLENFGRHWRCDDCGESFHDVPNSPVLHNEAWAKLAKPDESLCIVCLKERAKKNNIKLSIEMLRPCPINIGYLEHWIKQKKQQPPNADEWRKAFAAVDWHSDLLEGGAK